MLLIVLCHRILFGCFHEDSNPSLPIGKLLFSLSVQSVHPVDGVFLQLNVVESLLLFQVNFHELIVLVDLGCFMELVHEIYSLLNILFLVLSQLVL